jgi:hypothetical protein
VLGPLERPYLSLCLCKEPTSARVSVPSPEDGNRPSFRSTKVAAHLEFRAMWKVRAPGILKQMSGHLSSSASDINNRVKAVKEIEMEIL